jgi:hypothetical protein
MQRRQHNGQAHPDTPGSAVIVIPVFTEPESSSSILDENITLPDRCFVAEALCPPQSTRPWLYFREQAASCPDSSSLCPARLDCCAVLCGSLSPHSKHRLADGDQISRKSLRRTAGRSRNTR